MIDISLLYSHYSLTFFPYNENNGSSFPSVSNLFLSPSISCTNTEYHRYYSQLQNHWRTTAWQCFEKSEQCFSGAPLNKSTSRAECDLSIFNCILIPIP